LYRTIRSVVSLKKQIIQLNFFYSFLRITSLDVMKDERSVTDKNIFVRIEYSIRINRDTRNKKQLKYIEIHQEYHRINAM
jgi:hypothetical protein